MSFRASIGASTGTIALTTTAITGGSTGSLLYDNNGTLGETTITASTTALNFPQGNTTTPSIAWQGTALGVIASTGSTYLLSGSTRSHRFYSGGSVTLTASGGFNWSSSSDADGAADLSLARDAANTLALRNGGTNISPVPQAFRIYNFYTDASNYERITSGWASNIYSITMEGAGTGLTSRAIRFDAQGTQLDVAPSGAVLRRNGSSIVTLLDVSSTGMTSTALLYTRLAPTINQTVAPAAGTYTVLDINPTETSIGAGPHYLIRGRIGAGSDVFNVTNGGNITANAINVTSSGTAVIQFSGRGRISAPADGTFTFTNANSTDFGLLQFGGTTSSFPAWKRNGSQFLARKADDSGYTAITALQYQLSSNTVGSLPAASSWSFTIMAVTDATATTSRSVVAGGGANKVMVWSDGTNWLIF